MSQKNGFTLLEGIIAMFVFAVGALSAFALIERVNTFTSISASRFRAIYLAQEAVEIVRNIRDSNLLYQRTNGSLSWSFGLTTNCASGCEADYSNYPDYGNPSWSLVSYNGGRYLKVPNLGSLFYPFFNYQDGTDTKFKRKITIQNPQPDTLNVLVEIFWQERGQNFQVSSVQEDLYNWR